mgnify:CR=1 FL=1
MQQHHELVELITFQQKKELRYARPFVKEYNKKDILV